MIRPFLCFILVAHSIPAQVVTPKVLKSGQVDSTSLSTLAQGIYARSQAHTPREKAEAIWRFFLTDGRFVKPGFWYHIAGWAYEEPLGEVLDPIKLLNSYGFGLCYHIAPLLTAVYEAGGFEDARVWFLTGHTVAEVFYDGGYHYFDSDMMGYNSMGNGPIKSRTVASVHQIEENGNIILSKLAGLKQADVANVDQPWYPADVRAKAIGGLAELFTSVEDNRLYLYRRYPQGHQMSFVLRPGEKMTRYYTPENKSTYYLPYKFDGLKWSEFPQEIATYHIRTADGPRSQKDSRLWATGKIEYRPRLNAGRSQTIWMPCPYVIIDAAFAMDVNLSSAGYSLQLETSVDGGQNWTEAGRLTGPFHGPWQAHTALITKSEHGQLSTVSGSYGYTVRFTTAQGALKQAVDNLLVTTRFQLNPRTLPELTPGRNELRYTAGSQIRRELPVRLSNLPSVSRSTNMNYVREGGQGYAVNKGTAKGDVVLPVIAEGSALDSVAVGARFLDLRDGLAPDKFTAEVRRVPKWPAQGAPVSTGSIAWSTRPGGPFQTVWTYDSTPHWRDGVSISRTLRWPEVDVTIAPLPHATRMVYVRYRIQGLALDDVRLAAIEPAASASPLLITHIWRQNGVEQRHLETMKPSYQNRKYVVNVPEGVNVTNDALIFEAAAP